MIKLRQNKGFALTFSLIFIFLIVSFMAVYIMAVVYGNFQATRAANLKKAYYVADAGLADAYERIVHSGLTLVPQSAGCTNVNIPSSCTTPYISSTTASTDNGTYKVGSVTGNYIVSVQYFGSPRTKYVITSQGFYGTVSRTLQLTIIGKTIAAYAYWSQTEINPNLGTLWWISGMLTQGPVQTNGTLNIIGNPVFTGSPAIASAPAVPGAVAEAGASPNYKNGTGSDPSSKTTSDPPYIFPNNELTNNAPAITLPPASTLSNYQTAAGLILTGASTVIFNSSGTVTVTGKVVNSNCSTTTTYNNTTISAPTGGVIYVQSTGTIPNCHSSATDGNVTVQGTVKGQLTVAADQNIYISGNVQYNTNPVTSPSTDVLGLVASNNITVQEASAPAQLTVDGVLVALQGSFNVDQYKINPAPISGGLDGANMTQFGSLINYASGCTGVVNSSGQLVSGWNQLQSYDNRLKTLAPPGFPPLVDSSNNALYVKQNISECFSGNCG